MRRIRITLDTPVQKVMQRYPGTVPVFRRNGMHCFGCALARFHTVADAAHEYGLDAPSLLAALVAAVKGENSGQIPLAGDVPPRRRTPSGRR
jgi:hybrid cluster-associated redox disulfide protein